MLYPKNFTFSNVALWLSLPLEKAKIRASHSGRINLGILKKIGKYLFWEEGEREVKGIFGKAL
jgi:hypothetical protein